MKCYENMLVKMYFVDEMSTDIFKFLAYVPPLKA